jgi:hypothetical protein
MSGFSTKAVRDYFEKSNIPFFVMNSSFTEASPFA